MKAIKNEVGSLLVVSQWILRITLLLTCIVLPLFSAERIQASSMLAEAEPSELGTGDVVEPGAALIDDWYYDGDLQGGDFGYAVSTAGDVNGDGWDDILVAAPKYSIGTSKGAVFLFYGRSDGLQSPPIPLYYPGAIRFGSAIGSAGDVNGDGYADVIVGAPDYKDQYASEGRVFLFLGSDGGLDTEPVWMFDGDLKYAELGAAVGTAGDVNGDGFDDVVVGAPGYSNGDPGAGRIYVFMGSPSTTEPISTTYWFDDSTQIGARLGAAVSTAGDVNGDGYGDVLVGAPRFAQSEMIEGAVYLYYGSDDGLAKPAAWFRTSGQDECGYGAAVGGAGDVNGDGYDDLIVGAAQYQIAETTVGAAFVYYGSATGPGTHADWMGHSPYAGSNYGYSLGTAGDVNGDDYDDVIVGAYLYPGLAVVAKPPGAAFIYHGGPGGLMAFPTQLLESKADAQFGYSVGTAGDVKGDGCADVLVGAPTYKISTDPYGRAYGFYGPIAAPDLHVLHLPLILRGFSQQ